MAFRSLLFTPGSRPERFGKALGAGAGAVCLDLEDAVAPEHKAQARVAALDFIAGVTTARCKIGVRINAGGTPEGAADVDALMERLQTIDEQIRALDDDDLTDARLRTPDFIMLPKVESPEELAALNARLGGAKPLWPLVESAEGLRNAWDIAASPGVVGVLFGGADFAADIGAAMEWEPLLHARGRLVAACARAEVELLDVPHLDVRDADGLAASTARVRSMGFTGRACIHPDQVAAVNAAFSPGTAEVDHARRVMQAYREARGGVALLDGKLVERPSVRMAERVLSHADL